MKLENDTDLQHCFYASVALTAVAGGRSQKLSLGPEDRQTRSFGATSAR